MKVLEAIEAYLSRKRANGLSYRTEEFTLCEFRRHVGDLLLADISPGQVLEFLNARRVCNNTMIAKHRCLRMFFEFWTDRGYMSELTMSRPPQRDDDRLSTPFVYRRTEVRRLIEATHSNQTHGLCAVSAVTFRTVLLSLYGTGAMPSEIFWLKRNDLDLRRSFIFLRGDKVVLARRVPLGNDLNKILASYLHSEDGRRLSGPNVFVSKHGKPLTRDMMVDSFARLRMRAGVVRVDGGMCPPRMRDLRQTFAVHRIASWIKEGADLNRMLPALSAYMGFAGYGSIQRFLRMTPERFKRELAELSPHNTRKHWRDDAELMRFLSSLQIRATGN